MNPILLVILDGAGDRQQPALGGLTPLEAATTPNLDTLARSGVTGLLWPLHPGVAPTSPLAHFVLFGYDAAEFPGRGLIEALGEGLAPEPGTVICRVNFVRTEVREGALFITERPDPRAGGPANADIDLGSVFNGVACRFVHTGAAQGLLILEPTGPWALSAHVTDADPLRSGEFVRQVVPWAEATDPEEAERTAAAMNAWMLETRRRLAGRDLNTALVKWAATARPLDSFEQRTGLRGATLARGSLYRGLARCVGIDTFDVPASADPARDLADDLGRALDLLEMGRYDFVHVHTKWPDVVAHRKSPERKRQVMEALDAAFEPHLERLCRGDALVCVTADHQTPSSGPLYHSGGAVPLLMTGGASGRDEVARFAERDCRTGALGHIHGTDLMPLLLDQAERSGFMGAERYTAHRCLGTAPASGLRRLMAE